MFREAIIAVTKAADWYALHPLTVEELREKNIGSSVSIRYSTVGKNMTPMGNYEPSPINEGVGNVRKGQCRREIPEKAAEYFAYYLDEEGELLCAEMREKSCLREKELVTVEAHRVLDWTDNISIYSYSANGGPISELMVYVRDDRKRVTARGVWCFSRGEKMWFYGLLLTCFEYYENGKPAASISYRFILTDKQWDKMRDGTIEEPFGYKVRIE